MGKVPVSGLLGFTVGIALIFSSCQKKIEEKDQFASINGKILSTSQLDAYKRVKSMYPANTMDLSFPGSRSLNSIAVEVEALFKDAERAIGSKIKNDIDWKWKSRYYISQNYLINIISKNWGYSDKEIKDFYDSNIDKFTETVTKEKKPENMVTTKEPEKYDSAYVVPFDKVRNKVAIELFKMNSEPDSAFKVDFISRGARGDILDAWVQYIGPRKDVYFMKTFYKEKYGKTYPDSLNEILGEGKPVEPKDLEMIFKWLPEKDRKSFEDPQKKRTLVEWLLKWKLYEDKAKEIGYHEENDITEVSEAAWKYEVVLKYLNEEVFTGFVTSVSVDESLLRYQNWDRTGVPYGTLNEKALENLILSAKKTKAVIMLDSVIYDYRVKSNVKYLQDKFSDGKLKAPEAIKAEIDSLLEAGKGMRDVQKKYKLLTDEYAFTDIGKNALIELAKIKSEQGNFHGAIKDYRRYLTIAKNQDKFCSVFFMIGYIYGENLSKYPLAEANYKWILKNTPDCELANDAEFMTLHLGEPMIEVEELQAETKRQGKSIE